MTITTMANQETSAEPTNQLIYFCPNPHPSESLVLGAARSKNGVNLSYDADASTSGKGPGASRPTAGPETDSSYSGAAQTCPRTLLPECV